MNKLLTRDALAKNSQSIEYFFIQACDFRELLLTRNELLAYRCAPRGLIEVRKFKSRRALEWCVLQQKYRSAKRPWCAVVD